MRYRAAIAALTPALAVALVAACSSSSHHGSSTPQAQDTGCGGFSWCTTAPAGNGGGNPQAQNTDCGGFSWCTTAPAPAAGGGGVPVTRADAGPPNPAFECHDSFYPNYPGFSLVKGSDGIVRLKFSVSIYCDTIAQVPASQNTYLAVYYGHNTTVPVRQVTYTDLPGASILAPTRYTTSIVCLAGDYTGKYVISNIVTQDGRTLPRYPLNGAIASSYTTTCKMS